MTFVVASFVRGRWVWLRVIDTMTIENVTQPARTVTYQLGDRNEATIWKAEHREDATKAANVVKGIVIRSDWVPPSQRDRIEVK